MKINIIKEKDKGCSSDTNFKKGCPNYVGVEYHGNEAYWGTLTFGHLLCIMYDLYQENDVLKNRISDLETKLEKLEENLEEIECLV